MLHTKPEPLDADTETAIEDVLDAVREMGAAAALVVRAEPGSKAQRAHSATVRSLYELVASRARSALIDPAELLNHASDRIAGRAVRNRLDVENLDIAAMLGLAPAEREQVAA